jgi:hypothetical protein
MVTCICRTTITAILTFLAVLSGPALATGPGLAQMDAAMATVRHKPLGLENGHYLDAFAYPFAGTAFIDGFGVHWFVIGLYYLEPPFGPQNEGDYIARILDRDNGKPRERWASGHRCPALLSFIKSMTTLQAPAVNHIPGPLDLESASVKLSHLPLDPPAYIVWGTGRDEPGTLVDVEFSGDSSSHVGEWVKALQDGMQECWMIEPPVRLVPPPK